MKTSDETTSVEGVALTAELDLLPCPFCGGQPRLETRDVEPQGDPWYGGKIETFVLCECGACLFDGYFHEGFYDAETRAVEAWNKRKSNVEFSGTAKRSFDGSPGTQGYASQTEERSE